MRKSWAAASSPPAGLAEVAAPAGGGGVFAGFGDGEGGEWLGGVGGDQVDDAAEGAGAVEVGAAAGGDGDLVDGLGGEFVPVDPSAEGVVEWGVCRRGRGCGWRRWSRGPRREIPWLVGFCTQPDDRRKELEACVLAEALVEGEGGELLEVGGGEGGDGAVGGAEVEGGAGGG